MGSCLVGAISYLLNTGRKIVYLGLWGRTALSLCVWHRVMIVWGTFKHVKLASRRSLGFFFSLEAV